MAKSWNDLIRDAVNARGLSLYAVSKQTGIAVAPIQRFMQGKNGVSVATAEKLAPVVGIELRLTRRRKGK